MRDTLEFIFSSFWIWGGVMLLIWQIGFALALPAYYVYRSLLFKKKEFRMHEWMMTPLEIAKYEKNSNKN